MGTKNGMHARLALNWNNNLILPRPPPLNRLESELRFRPSLTEIGFPFRAICAYTLLLSLFDSRSNMSSRRSSFPCRSKLSQFRTSFSDLTTNRIPLKIRTEQSTNSGKIEEDVTQFSCP